MLRSACYHARLEMDGSSRLPEASDRPDRRFSPIVIAGMHRSGTSYLTSLLHASGLPVAERLMAPDAGNPRGYFEDLDFYELHLRMLHACTRNEPGFRDWGWTESEALDRGRLPEFRAAAMALVRSRRERPGVWGWKDPRTALLLDFWDEVLTAAETSPGYLLVYRSPWDVADAIQRLRADVFLEHPDYAYRIWTFYNRQLLDFHRRNRHRSLLVAIRTILADPPAFASLLAARLGQQVDAGACARLYAAGGLITRAADDPLIGLVAATSPEAIRLLGELDHDADLPAAALWRRPGPLRAPPAPPQPPAVTVVIPCHDDGELLLEAVASAESHAPGSELIVIDDGSRQPRTLQVLDVLRRAGYRVLDAAGDGDGSPGAACNTGCAAARGRYLLPLAAADRLHGGFLAAAIGLLDADGGLGAVYGDRLQFGRRAGQVTAPDFDLDRLLGCNFIGSCALIRRAAWEACGGYDARLSHLAAWELWIAMAERGWRLAHVPAVACEQRIRPGAWIPGEEQAVAAEPMWEQILHKHQALYLSRLPLLISQRCAGRGPQVEVRVEAEQPGGSGDLPTAAPAAALAAERDRLYRELEAWQERVRFMESTRAWRLRGLLLRLRG